MLSYSVLLLCGVACVITTKDVHVDLGYKGDLDDAFSLWPSLHNTAKLIISKRQAIRNPGDTTALHNDLKIEEVKGSDENEKETMKQVGHGEGIVEDTKPLPTSVSPLNATKNQTELVTTTPSPKMEPVKENSTQNATSSTVSQSTTVQASNTTTSKATKYQPDLSNPGVMKRGLIVFGGFSILAIAYFIFFRRKGKNNDSNNTHGINDSNQFRYGVLQSDDQRDNLELSRILTVESDEDEDEDLEIFDLEQKKKSLSYVNLQTNDEYVVHGSRENVTDRDNLLLDIEDANSDTLINWSSNSTKSIL